jgi:DNA topoisomerase-1
VSAAIKHVAAELGNTPAVCRKAYVHPAVVNAYLEGALAPEGASAPTAERGLSDEEACALALLRQATGADGAAA